MFFDLRIGFDVYIVYSLVSSLTFLRVALHGSEKTSHILKKNLMRSSLCPEVHADYISLIRIALEKIRHVNKISSIIWKDNGL